MTVSATTCAHPCRAAQLTVLLQHLVTLINDEELELLQAHVLLQHQLQRDRQQQRQYVRMTAPKMLAASESVCKPGTLYVSGSTWMHCPLKCLCLMTLNTCSVVR